MSCETASRNATPPAPAWSADLAPGAPTIDPAQAARDHVTDPRLARLVPGFDAPFFQAGLAGYSDAAMRIVARREGCPLCVTEALLDRTLIAGGRGFAKADLGELEDNVPGGSEDQPLVGQIMGCEPDEMAAAAVKMVEQAKRPPSAYRKLARFGLSAAPPGTRIEPAQRQDATPSFASIDVNLACPVKKINRKARGGHWLREPDGAIDILRAVREALPHQQVTSIKMRRGFDDSPEAESNFLRILDAAFELGYGFVTVHGRTVEQKYVGPSRWLFLRKLMQLRPDALVFGSGDIWNVHDIFRMLSYTGVKAVSVARGSIGNPWIFRQARDMMAGRPPAPPTIAEQRAVLLHHFELSVAINGETRASKMMRKFGLRFAQHHPDGEQVRLAFINVNSIDQWRAVLDRYYNTDDASVRTETTAVRTIPVDPAESQHFQAASIT
ncbi:MAG: tRNA-dihydrouridine synthase [Phycisphaerales bacterium]|nr:tRNA-dihydrouridine synthase [Phycisphaerales bacterium]